MKISGKRKARQIMAAAPKPPPALSIVFVVSTRGNTKSMFTGEWETDFPGPLSVDLKIDGTNLTGTVGRIPISDGLIDGNTRSFKVSAGADRTITITGTVAGNKIDFIRYVHVVPCGRPGGIGFFGAAGAQRFRATRRKTSSG